MIELKSVTKRFGGETAVDAISLTVNRGELCALVGTSGCGKSTTLRMINRLIEHDGRVLHIDVRPIRESAMPSRVPGAFRTGPWPATSAWWRGCSSGRRTGSTRV